MLNYLCLEHTPEEQQIYFPALKGKHENMLPFTCLNMGYHTSYLYGGRLLELTDMLKFLHQEMLNCPASEALK